MLRFHNNNKISLFSDKRSKYLKQLQCTNIYAIDYAELIKPNKMR